MNTTTTADPITAGASELPENVGLVVLPPLEGRALNPVPRWAEVLREQLSSVGLALKREAQVVAAFMGLFTAFVLIPGNGAIPLSPSVGIATGLAALLIPLVIWKGEDPARRGYHHAMPVDHGPHAIARGAAGLAWTLAGVAAFFAWVGLLSAMTGGDVEEVESWQWVAPFVGATAVYLLGSALTLVTSRPWKWLGLGAVVYIFVDSFRQSVRPLAEGVEALFGWHYGLSTLLIGGESSPWILPDVGPWLVTAFLWMSVALTLFLWAAYRQPER